MLRRLTILAAACCLLATSAFAQGSRSRRVEQRPAAAVGTPRPEPGAAPAAAVAAVPFSPGETLSYDVEWNNNTTAATLVMRVGDRATYFGQEGLELSADVETVGMIRFLANVEGTFKSYSNPKTLLSFHAENRQTVNGKTTSRTVVFDRQKNLAIADSRSTPIGAETSDPLALFYHLRAMPLKVGDTITLDGYFEKREQWKVVVEAREAVQAPRGRANAFRVAFMPIKGGQPDDRNKIRIWFTDDAARLPVLITAEPSFGPIRMTLSSATGTKG